MQIGRCKRFRQLKWQNKISAKRGAAIAQLIRLRLPSYCPEFESQAHIYLYLYQFIFELFNVEEMKINIKRPGLAHWKNSNYGKKVWHHWCRRLMEHTFGVKINRILEFLNQSVWPDCTTFERSWWQIVLQEKSKYTYGESWSYLENITFKQ